MNRLQTTFPWLLAGLLLCAIYAFGQASKPAPPTPGVVKLVVSGDPQFRSGWDYWSGGVSKRRPVIAGMTAEQAQVVLFNGDLVEEGEDKDDWRLFDEEMRPLRESTQLFVASIGNHDLHGDHTTALNNFFSRITVAERREFYSLQRGPVLLIILNSNAPLTPGSEQRKLLEAQLRSVPPTVKYVITSMHHPMRTRSRRRGLTRGHKALPEHIELGNWLETVAGDAHYRIIAFSGHVHNYERYDSNGVMFIVSGGAGGRPHIIEREPQDAYTGSGPTYHYCLIEATPAELRFKMRRFDTEDEKWKDGDSFTLQAIQ
jgi:hypothetical protein